MKVRCWARDWPDRWPLIVRFSLAALAAASVLAAGFSYAAEPKESRETVAHQEGWQQAGPGAERLGQQLRSHRVRLEEQGRFTGQIFAWSSARKECSAVQKASVNLVQSGRVVHQVALEPTGQFAIEGVKPGVYGVIVAGADGFLADTVQIADAASAKVGNAREFSAVIRPVYFQLERARLDIDSLAVSPASFEVLKRLITRYVPREAAVLVSLVQPSETDTARGAVPDEEERGRSQRAAVAQPEAQAGQTAYPASTIRQHAVHLLPDGRLLGRARRLHRESGRPLRIHRTTVFMIRENDVVAASPIDELGVFVFEGLKPGMHSMVATGPEGFAAFSVQIEPPAQAGMSGLGPSRAGSKFHLAAAQQSPDLALDLAMLDPENFGVLWDILGREMGWLPVGAASGGPPPAGTAGPTGPSVAGRPDNFSGVVPGAVGGGSAAMSGFGGVAGGSDGSNDTSGAASGSEEPPSSPFRP
ncbi:MAG: hypothetical protein HUU20_08510 [Pirellulales bacterium]|nr:hypothetical protein [Pirellulales bacterium]